MLNIWFWLACGMGVTHSISRWFERKWLGRITKPAVMVTLLIWFWGQGGWRGVLAWFWLGLLFSLAGDVLLMLRGRWFLWGAGAFLCAHICYFMGFNLPSFFLHPVRFFVWIPFLGLDLFFILYANRMWPGRTTHTRLIPIAGSIYYTLLSLMCASACSTLVIPFWTTSAALLAAGGGVLFLISDSILIFDHFLRRVTHAHFWVMTTYYLAQMGIISGAILQLSR